MSISYTAHPHNVSAINKNLPTLLNYKRNISYLGVA